MAERRAFKGKARSPTFNNVGPREGAAPPSNPAGARTPKYAAPLTHTIAFRCSASEKARLDAEAARARRPLAELLRERLPLVHSGHRKTVPPADPSLLVALSRLGANLNQVARAINAARKMRAFHQLDIMAVSAALVAIDRELEALRELGHRR